MSFTVMLTLEWQVCPDCCGLCPICRVPKCGRWYVHFGETLLIWQHLGATCHLSRAESPFSLQKCLVLQVKRHVSAIEGFFCSQNSSHFSFLDPKRATLTPKFCVANRTGRSNARITVARLRFEWGIQHRRWFEGGILPTLRSICTCNSPFLHSIGKTLRPTLTSVEPNSTARMRRNLPFSPRFTSALHSRDPH